MHTEDFDSNILTIRGLLESLQSIQPRYKNSSDALLATVKELKELPLKNNLSAESLLAIAETESAHSPEFLHAFTLLRRISFLKQQTK